VEKIDVNGDKDSLATHPYIDWPIAKVISNYRKQHGPYNSPEEILKTKIITDSLYNKLKPYLE